MNGQSAQESVDRVVVGSMWRGLTGNVLVIREVADGMARWTYRHDPADGSTDEVWKIAEFFDEVKPRTLGGDAT